eukprot:353350-Chlamydomonas_euryale.AAC.18
MTPSSCEVALMTPSFFRPQHVLPASLPHPFPPHGALAVPHLFSLPALSPALPSAQARLHARRVLDQHAVKLLKALRRAACTRLPVPARNPGQEHMTITGPCLICVVTCQGSSSS